MTQDSVYYFAYGSNADPDRFRERVGEWRSRSVARLEGYALRFAASVQSEGGGGAVIDEAPGDFVDGVLYEISQEQMEAMDREEFDPSRDIQRKGRRLKVEVTTTSGLQSADCYTVQDEGTECPPSETYLGHILRGLEAAGHPLSTLDRVRDIAHKTETGD